MKKNNQVQIRIPSNFRLACAIYKVEIAEVLQVFIDHVTFIDSLHKGYSPGYSEASWMIGNYVKSHKISPTPSMGFKKNMDTISTALQSILNLHFFDGDISKLRNKSAGYVKTIFHAMERVYTPSDRLYLNEDSVLYLNQEICVLSELYNCYPSEFLEYFMDHISLAQEDAFRGLKREKENYLYLFFLSIVNGFGRDANQPLHLTEQEIDFYEKKRELHLEIFIVRDPKERTAILQNFYQTHYQNMNPQ
ncbi:hypothetical protein ACSBL2_09875 [Pedobacter sp. AW31-3R]|uniref:hypothetical protein n=1 Tax=Pedobacter sp. AW31-3R TaxID=3445781 RepID=UPI003FA10E66